MTTLYETEDKTKQNGSAKQASSKVENSFKPLIDGSSVEISQDLIDQTVEAMSCDLPKLEADDEIIEPSADELTDEGLQDHVSSTLYASATVVSVMVVVNALKRTYDARKNEVDRLFHREIKLQGLLDELIPASKSASNKQGYFLNLKVFFVNWSSLAAALLSTWLLATIATEVLYQIGGLRESDWGLVQSFFGAFGFTWGFTMAVVVATFWHSHTKANRNAERLSRQMSFVAFWLAWIGLTGFGLMLGLMHSFEGEEGWLLPVLRCLLTTISVLSLGMICVAIEKGVCHTFKRSYKWTLMENEKVKEKDNEIHPLVNQRQILGQIEELAIQVEKRIEEHVRSQVQQWISRRNAIRKTNLKQEAMKAEQLKIQLAQQRLAGLN